jgi:hypothetical protein
MKKLMLIASLALVAVALVPAASASAALTGSCELRGEAELNPPLGATPKATKFKFTNATGAEKVCNGVEGTEVKKLAILQAKVEGEGQLSCPVGENLVPGLEGGVSGTGEIELEGETSVKHVSFRLVAAAGIVTFTVEGEGVTATGVAEFVTSTKSVKQCAALNASSLEFTAVAAGTL